VWYTFIMEIRIRYFASLREIVGLNKETLSLPEGARVSDVRTLLLSHYPRLQPILERSACSVNHGYVSSETTLQTGDEIVFIPPVGGGSSGGPVAWSH
jgi:molybdopterin synthase sulfur carrier subunit